MVGDRDRLHHLVDLAAAGSCCSRHTDVDRAALVGNELLRATDLHRRGAESVDEIARGFAEDANLLTFDVLRRPDLAAACQELYRAVIEIPEHARTGLPDLLVDELADRAIWRNGLAEGFVVGKHERDAEDRSHWDGPCELVDEHEAHIDGTGGYCLRDLASLVELRRVVNLDLESAVALLLDQLLKISDVLAQLVIRWELGRDAQRALRQGLS